MKRKSIVLILLIVVCCLVLFRMWLMKIREAKHVKTPIIVQSIGPYSEKSEFVYRIDNKVYYINKNNLYRIEDNGESSLIAEEIGTLDRKQGCLISEEDKVIDCEKTGVYYAEGSTNRYEYLDYHGQPIYFYDEQHIFVNTVRKDLLKYVNGISTSSYINEADNQYWMIVYYDSEYIIVNMGIARYEVISLNDENKSTFYYEMNLDKNVMYDLCHMNSTKVNGKVYFASIINITRGPHACSYGVEKENHQGSLLIELDSDTFEPTVLYQTSPNEWIVGVDEKGYYTLTDNVLDYYGWGNNELISTLEIEGFNIKKRVVVISVKDWLFIYNNDELLLKMKLNYADIISALR